MDASEDDLRRNTEAFMKNTAALNKLAEALGMKGNSARGGATARLSNQNRAGFDIKRARDQFAAQTESLSRSMRTLSGGADSLMAGFDGLLRKVAGGALVAEIIGAGKHLSDQYKKLTDIGQTFGGSMFEMARQAGEAGLPLGRFAELLGRNSTASAVLATQNTATRTSMGELQKSVRDATRDFGFYGMSVDDITGLTSDYSETLRLQGRAASINKDQTAKEISSFAQDISDFAQVTGKSRTQIAKATMDAMHDVAYASRDFTAAQQESGRKAITFMASMPGQAGDMLSKMLSQTIAYGGAVFADDMHTFVDAGQGAFLNVMDTIASKVNRGGAFDEKDEAENLLAMQKYYRDNKANLLAQSRAGNQSARQVLGMLEQLNSLNAEQYAEKRRAQQQFKEFTNFFGKIENDLMVLSGKFVKGMMAPLAALDATGGKFPDLIAVFSDVFEHAGTVVGDFIAKWTKPENLVAMADTMKTVMAAGVFLADGLGVLAKGVMWAVDAFAGLTNLLHNQFGDQIGGIMSGVLAATLLFGRKIYNLYRMIRPKDVQIRTNHVSIAQGGLGGRPGGPGAHHDASHGASGGKPRRGGMLGQILGEAAALAEGAVGLMGGGNDCCDGMLAGLESLKERIDFHGERAHANATEGRRTADRATTHAGLEAGEHVVGDAAAKAAPHVVEDVAKAGGSLAFRAGRQTASVAAHATESVAKAALKTASTVAKFTPGLGLVMGGVFAAQRAMEGDFIGAAGELLGGIASTVPVIGTAADAVIQAGLFTRDMVGHDKTDNFVGGLFHGSSASPSASAATPATPNDQDNPYSGQSEAALREDYDDVSRHLEAARAAADQQADMIKQIGAGNEIQANIQKLMTEKNQIDAAAQKKSIDLQKKQVSTGELLLNAAT